MGSPISSIRNLGPATEAEFNKVGISTAEELRKMGADQAYCRLLQAGKRPHFIGYYVLVMALQGRPWNDCKGQEKKALRAQFDALKADCLKNTVHTELERKLDMIGIRPDTRTRNTKP